VIYTNILSQTHIWHVSLSSGATNPNVKSTISKETALLQKKC
jgi:hypothetical protein